MDHRAYKVLHSVEALAATPAGKEAFARLAALSELPGEVAGEAVNAEGGGIERAYHGLLRGDRREVVEGLRAVVQGA